MPPPKCATTNRQFSYGFPRLCANLRAIAFWFSAWNTLLRSIPGIPVSFACLSISSTTTGSTT